MKKLFVFIVILFNLSTYSQINEVFILVKDSQTDKELANAPIFIKEINRSGATNAFGVFKLSLSSQATLEINLSNYTPIQLSTALLTERLNIIYLDPIVNSNTEKVVTVNHPYKLLTDLVQNSKNQLKTPIELQVYVLELFKANNIYFSFNDGLLNFYVKDKNNKINTDIIVQQNRFNSIVGSFFSDNIMGYNLNGLMNNNYKFDQLNELFLDNNYTKYNFLFTELEGTPQYNNINIELKDSINEALPNYDIIYDPVKMLIINVKATIPTQVLQYAKPKKVNNREVELCYYTFELNYTTTSNVYHFASLTDKIGVVEHKVNIPNYMEVTNYFVVDKINTMPVNYNHKEVFKQKSLNKAKTKYYNKYWESRLPLSKEQTDFIQQLSSKTLN